MVYKLIIRVVLIISSLFFALNVFGQKATTLSFYVMPQRTMFLNRDEISTYKGIVENVPTYAYSYGLIMSQNFTKRLGLEFGFCGSRVEQMFKVHPYKGSPVVAIDKKKSVLYVNVPILLRTTLVDNPKNTLFVSAGPALSILMSEDGIIPVYFQNVGVPSDTVLSYDIAESSGAYRKLVLSGSGVFGWNRKVYKNLYFQLSMRVDYTLTDIENKSYDTVYIDTAYQNVYLMFNKDRPATHILAVGAGIGLSLKIR